VIVKNIIIVVFIWWNWGSLGIFVGEMCALRKWF